MNKIRTLILALIGSLVASWLSLPLPFLLGPMFACLMAALGGMRLANDKRAGEAMRTILGVAVGASITPELVGQLPRMAASVSLVPIYLLIVGAVGYPLLRRGFGFDPATSFYGAMPGGLQDMLIFGEEAGGDTRQLSLLHATRVLIVVTILPFILTWVYALDLTNPPGEPASTVPALEMFWMVACAIVGWLGAKRIGLFGASILGPMIVTAAASLAGIVHVRPPAEAIVAAQFFIGLGVGAQYSGITLAEIRRVVAAALVYVAAIGSIAAAFAFAVVAFSIAPAPAASMAFAPGGQAEMAVLAIVAGGDVAFVVAHHLVRLVMVILLAPLFARLILPKARGTVPQNRGNE